MGRNRRSIWLSCAMLAVMGHCCGGNWIILALLSAVCAGMVYCTAGETGWIGSKLLCAFQLVWILLLAATYLPMAVPYWPGEGSRWIIPAVLLALSAWASSKRAEAAVSTIGWILGVLAIPFLYAMVKDCNPNWLIPTSRKLDPMIVPALLLPIAAAWIPNGERKRCTPVALYTFGVLFWVLAASVLSPQVAGSTDTPLRLLGRTLTIGSASRFESVVSVMITLCWFGLLTMLLEIGKTLCKGMGIDRTWVVWGIAILVYGLYSLNVQQSPPFSAVMTPVLWVLVPKLHGKRKSKKSENNA